MPKQIWKIDKFHGGLNSSSDPRDILEEELAETVDIMVDELGKIRMMGGKTAHDAGSAPSLTIEPGYGLFYFSHDRRGGELATEHLTDGTSFTDSAITMTHMLSSAQKTALADSLDSQNNTFDFATGTTTLIDSDGFTATNATFVNSSAVGQLSNTASSQGFVSLPITTVANRTYQVEFDVTATSTSEINVSLGTGPVYNSSNKVTSSGTATGLTLDVPYTANDISSFLVLQLTSSTSGRWVKIDNLKIITMASDPTGDMTVNSTNATYTHSSGAGTLIQTADNRVSKGIANAEYSFTYTISGFSEVITDFEILGTGSQFAAATTALEQSNGTHTTTFTSHATDADQPFTINVTSGSSGAFSIDNVSLYITDQTGDDYLALAKADGSATIKIYSESDDSWSSSTIIDLGSTSGMKAVYYYVDGNLRVGDAAFGAGNRVQWYGYIDRRFYGDGSTGYDVTAADNGWLVNGWYSTNANLTRTSVKRVFGGTNVSSTPDTGAPIAIDLDGQATKYRLCTGTATPKSGDDKVALLVNWSSAADTLTDVSTTTGGMDDFCSVGDTLICNGSTSNDLKYFTVKTVTDTVITFNEDVTGSTTADEPYVTNLSKGLWYDAENPNFQFAVSTLYDNSKQESALLICEDIYCNYDGDTIYKTSASGSASTDGVSLTPFDITEGTQGLAKIRINFHLFTNFISDAVDGTTGFHDIRPRVSGFKIYMRREGVSTWYLQSEIDISKGIRWFQKGEYKMWGNGTIITNAATCQGEYLNSMREIETYESETGFDQEDSNIGFNANGLGFKTAVVANRRAYVGNISIKDESGIIRVKPDAILKSRVNAFDAFSIKNIIQVTVNDGSNIVKLEEYADRLLEFKKDKMTLINISQSVEFLEDTFMHKGVPHPAAVCKTDFGVAWVNKLGCYLYDGNEVTNLLERQGRQIIKESEWALFTTHGTYNEPMIGYIPKKRQLIFSDDTSTNGTGFAYLYDMVTQSWVKGAAGTFNDQDKTNFITDWNGDLVYAHTSGTVMKWDDEGDDSSSLTIATKDIDFGQPAQKKKVYKVYVTYTGVSSLIVNVDYQINGDNGWTGFSSGEPLTASSAQNEATLTLSPPVECYSFQLKFSGTGKTAFEINDISIVYRLKGLR